MHGRVQGFFSAVVVLDKVCMLLFTACFMQIPFSEHLVVQGLQVILFFQPSCCVHAFLIFLLVAHVGSCTQVGYCILRNRRMCSFLQERYLGMSGRCLRMAQALSSLSYEVQAPLKLRRFQLTEERACESVITFLQVSAPASVENLAAKKIAATLCRSLLVHAIHRALDWLSVACCRSC